jgi:hypothetical protein
VHLTKTLHLIPAQNTSTSTKKMNFNFADFDVASLQTSVQNYLEPVNTALHVGPMPQRPGLPEGPPPAKKNKGGHPKDPLLDELLEVDKDQVANAGQLQNVSRCTHYCRFCHKASAARDGPRAKKHAAFDCPNIPNRLREKVLDDMVKRSPKRLSVEEQRKLSMSDVERDGQASIASSHRYRHCGSCTCTIDPRREGESLDKASARRKSHQLDYAIVQLFSVCGLPLTLLDNPFWRNLMQTAVPTYQPPSSSHFKDELLPCEAANVERESLAILRRSAHLTSSFDGLTTPFAGESIYTHHATTPDGDSFLLAAHNYSAASHTADFLHGHFTQDMEKVGVDKFSGQCSDNAGNTRLCREKTSEKYPWILNMSDPSHHLHLTGKDMGEVKPVSCHPHMSNLNWPVTDFPECQIHDAIKVASRITAHFSHATANASKLDDLQNQFHITRGLESMGNTRFLTSYRCLSSVQRCLPAIKRGVANNILDLRAVVTTNGPAQESGGATARAPTKTNLRQYFDGSPMSEIFEAQLGFALAVLQPLYHALTMIEARSTTPADVFLHWIVIAHIYRIRFSLFGPQARAVWTGRFPDACIQVLTRLNNRFQAGVHNPAWNVKIYRDALFLHPGYHGSQLLDEHMNQRDEIARSLYRVFANTPDAEGKFPDADRHRAFAAQLSRYFGGHAPYNEVYTQGPTQQTPRAWWERLLLKNGNDVRIMTSTT